MRLGTCLLAVLAAFFVVVSAGLLPGSARSAEPVCIPVEPCPPREEPSIGMPARAGTVTYEEAKKLGLEQVNGFQNYAGFPECPPLDPAYRGLSDNDVVDYDAPQCFDPPERQDLAIAVGLAPRPSGSLSRATQTLRHIGAGAVRNGSAVDDIAADKSLAGRRGAGW